MTDGVWVGEVLILSRFHSRGFFTQTAASGVSGTRTSGWRLVGSSSFCGWLKQKYKEKCSCLVAWHETVRRNKAQAMDVKVFRKHSCIDDLPFAEVVAAVPRFQRLCWSINTTQQSFREELCWKVGFILRAENLWTRFVNASLFFFSPATLKMTNKFEVNTQMLLLNGTQKPFWFCTFLSPPWHFGLNCKLFVTFFWEN